MEGVSGCFALVVLGLIVLALTWYLWGRGGRNMKDEEPRERTREEQLQPEGDEPRDDPNARRDS